MASDDENPVKLADKIMALTWEASGEDIAKVMFMLQLPDAVRKTMWAEPLTSWPEMKTRVSGLWHAEGDTQACWGVNEAAKTQRTGGECRAHRIQAEKEEQQVPGLRCYVLSAPGRSVRVS